MKQDHRPKFDLIVIGGGPAGTSAAITAARGDARVVLLERGRFPRHKVCGEFVSAESLGLLAELLNLQDTALLHAAIRIRNARVFLDGRILRTVVDPPAASIARFDLDTALWSAAMECGVEAREQIAVRSISGRGPFVVDTSVGEFEARALINASGRWSNFSPAPPDNQNYHPRWLGLKGHFSESTPPASVDLYFFEGGYCGVQPVNLKDRPSGRINACAMVRADVAKALPEVFALNPALQERSRAWRPLSDPVSTSPLIFGEPQPERDGVLLTGDAAGFVDPFIGDGISLALRSGSLAAQCLMPFLAGNIPIQKAASNYSEIYKQQLAPVFRASSRIRRLVSLPPPLRRPIFALLENTPAITRYLVRKTRAA